MVSNADMIAITITSITLAGIDPGDFAQTNGCGSSLGASASCTISVTLKPTTTGTRRVTLKVTDSAAGSPQQVPLSGTGS
ncbi:MAG TPA: choice-of-anchor D domain-containing protein [Candidatus Sulfotelmatobacter sp.]|nr:choice-of-anchor D domain-containing protein [Candidatus Sulfotelmatobacter sp.]